MTIKTLLLGSAAAVAVVGGAQAADLSVAEPVEYVKVCDYFGTGYWYIPGTDTCIKISGYVEETAYFHQTSFVGSHSSSWNFQNTVQMDIDTKSETEYGVLEGLISFGSGTSNVPYQGRGNDYALGDDGAFVSLGGFKAGTYQLAAWNPVYAVTDNHGTANAELYGTFGYALLDTFQLSWASGGVSTSVAISDPTAYFDTFGYNTVGDSSPLITGNVGFSAKDVSFQVSGGFVNLQSGGAWGIDGMAHFSLGKDDSFELNAAYGSNAFIVNGWAPDSANNGWSVLGGWQHNLSKTLALQLVGSYADISASSATAYALNADLVWSPVANFSVTGALLYTGSNYSSSAWNASLSVKKTW